MKRTVGRRGLLRGVAGAGTAALALPGTAAAQGAPSGGVEPDWGDWFTGAATGGSVGNYDATDDRRGQDQVTVEVGAQGNGGPFAFEPPALWIDPGTTVTFEWASNNHNVVVEEGPGDAWAGHAPIEDSGFSFEHTFETGGIYKYFCQPHLSLGMKGAIAVGDGVPTRPAGGGGDGGVDGGGRPLPPGGQLGVAFMATVLGTAGLAALATLAVEFRDAAAAGGGAEAADPGAAAVREIGHDEFDPTGTAALIVLYFLILVAMWVFVYFVEFLGRGPTVIG